MPRPSPLLLEVEVLLEKTHTLLSPAEQASLDAWLATFYPKGSKRDIQSLAPFLMAHETGLRTESIRFVIENGFVRPADEQSLMHDLLERAQAGDSVALRVLSMQTH